MSKLRIGVDVGGTNTDSVLLDIGGPGNQPNVLASHKAPTTGDIVGGLIAAISAVLSAAPSPEAIESVSIGTTAFLNAIVERSKERLQRVAAIRLCGPATHSLPPFSDFPADLADVIKGQVFMVDGGYEVDGRPIREVSKDEIKALAASLPANAAVAVSGVFATIRPDQERQVRDLLMAERPDLQITISSDIAPQIGLLERENAAILNASLMSLARRTVDAIESAMHSLGLSQNTALYLTTNDGTVVSASDGLRRPIACVRSGPTNSMRGAAFLAGLTKGSDACMVCDIGGTTTDLGVLERNGTVRPAASTVSLGGVRSNFPCCDVSSCALGGGTIVRVGNGKVTLGPDSVGYEVTTKAQVFGGSVLTTTDIAVVSGLIQLGTTKISVDPALLTLARAEIKATLEREIDKVKTEPSDMPLLLVGGGSILVPDNEKLAGVSKAIKPPHFAFANAVGAAIALVSGSVDSVADLSKRTEREALDEAEKEARRICVHAGGDEASIEVVAKESVPLSYLPSTATRIVVKVVGERKGGNKAAASSSGATAVAVAATKEAKETVLAGDRNPSQPATATATAPSTWEPLLPSTPTPPASSYRPDIRNGVWYLSSTDIHYISEGTGILGCGGGGSPYRSTVRALSLLKQGKQIRVVPMESVADDEKVLNVAFIGSPVASAEKLSNGLEVGKVLDAVVGEGDRKGRKIMAAEIGGGNGIVPMLSAAETEGYVVDADGMGRAFPRLDHFGPFVYGIPCVPTAICDESGNVIMMKAVRTFADLERFMRVLAVEMGSTAAMSTTPLIGADVRRTCVVNSVSLAWRLGRAVVQSRTDKSDVVKGILSVCPGKLLFSGKIVQVTRTTTAGFARGEVHLVGLDDGSGSGPQDKMLVRFQNENIVAEVNGKVVSTSPDLITLLDADSSSSLATEEVRYGLRCKVIAMLCSPIWQTEQALSIVGPEAFGYPGVTYKPIAEGKYVCKSVIEEFS